MPFTHLPSSPRPLFSLSPPFPHSFLYLYFLLMLSSLPLFPTHFFFFLSLNSAHRIFPLPHYLHTVRSLENNRRIDQRKFSWVVHIFQKTEMNIWNRQKFGHWKHITLASLRISATADWTGVQIQWELCFVGGAHFECPSRTIWAPCYSKNSTYKLVVLF